MHRTGVRRRAKEGAFLALAALAARGVVSATIDITICAGLMVVLVTLLMVMHVDPRTTRARVSTVVTTSVWTAVVGYAGWGLAMTVRDGVAGVICWLGLAVLLELSARAVDRCTRRRAARARSRAAVPPSTLDGMSLSDLCRRWRASTAHLGAAAGPAEIGLVSILRAAYLDELERRDPRGFDAWLGQGDAAVGDPEQFLRELPRSPDLGG